MTDDEFSRWIASATKAKTSDVRSAAALFADAIRILTEGIKTNGRAEPETEAAMALRDIFRSTHAEGEREAWTMLEEAAQRGWDRTMVEEEPELPRDTRDWRDV